MIFEKQKTLKASDRFIQDICGLPDTVKNNTIILIGPMGTGKSTVAKNLREQMKKMCAQFKNIILLPSMDKEKSREILQLVKCKQKEGEER